MSEIPHDSVPHSATEQPTRDKLVEAAITTMPTYVDIDKKRDQAGLQMVADREHFATRRDLLDSLEAEVSEAREALIIARERYYNHEAGTDEEYTSAENELKFREARYREIFDKYNNEGNGNGYRRRGNEQYQTAREHTRAYLLENIQNQRSELIDSLRTQFDSLIALNPDLVAHWSVQEFQDAMIAHEELKEVISHAEKGLQLADRLSALMDGPIYQRGRIFSIEDLTRDVSKPLVEHNIIEGDVTSINTLLDQADNWPDMSPTQLVELYKKIVVAARELYESELSIGAANLEEFRNGIRNDQRTQQSHEQPTE
ncbi:MAG: hypothetical protein WAQ25_04755 [Candidatus Saccharimonas sp.]